jgi:hypothetical protein
MVYYDIIIDDLMDDSFEAETFHPLEDRPTLKKIERNAPERDRDIKRYANQYYLADREHPRLLVPCLSVYRKRKQKLNIREIDQLVRLLSLPTVLRTYSSL